MSDAMLEKLSTVDVATVVVLIILISLASSFITPHVEKFKASIIYKYKKEKREEDISKLVKEDHARIEKYEGNRIHDREQSFKIQKELVDAIQAINDRLDEMQRITEQKFKESRERDDKRTRAELKDRISQVYRYHHATGKWTSMEKESLKDLIQEYEDAGGLNSFVHTTVAEEMYTWEITDED